MSQVEPERIVIAAGRQPLPGYRHLLPIAKFLIEDRGHLPLHEPEKNGFVSGGCHLSRSITEEDWAAVKERFVLPETIQFGHGRIRDNLNRVNLTGYDEIEGEFGVESAEDWEARQRGG